MRQVGSGQANVNSTVRTAWRAEPDFLHPAEDIADRADVING